MAPKTYKGSTTSAHKAIKDKKLAANPVYHLFGYYLKQK